MKAFRNTTASALITAILWTVFTASPECAFGQTTLTEDTARVDTEAFIALENSEQYHYALSGNLFNLWIEKKKECDTLTEQINLLRSNESAKSEVLAIYERQLASAANQLRDIEDRLKKSERKARRRGTWGNVKAGIALALGVYLGNRVLK